MSDLEGWPLGRLGTAHHEAELIFQVARLHTRPRAWRSHLLGCPVPGRVRSACASFVASVQAHSGSTPPGGVVSLGHHQQRDPQHEDRPPLCFAFAELAFGPVSIQKCSSDLRRNGTPVMELRTEQDCRSCQFDDSMAEPRLLEADDRSNLLAATQDASE